MLCELADRLIPCLPDLKRIPGWTTAYAGPAGHLRNMRNRRFLGAKKPFVARWRKNIRLWIHPGEETSACVYLEGHYEPNQLSFLNGALRPGMTFVDVGANAGIYSLFAADKVGPSGRVVAIEPSAREFAKLSANVALNRFNNVRIENLAAFDAEGSLDLNVAAYPHSGHNTAGAFAYPETGSAGTERVRAVPIDALSEERGWRKPDFLKLDVEGSEHRVLLGARRTIERFRPVLLIEIFDRSLRAMNSSAAEVASLLTSFRYRLMTYDAHDGKPVPVEDALPLEATEFLAIPKNGG